MNASIHGITVDDLELALSLVRLVSGIIGGLACILMLILGCSQLIHWIRSELRGDKQKT